MLRVAKQLCVTPLKQQITNSVARLGQQKKTVSLFRGHGKKTLSSSRGCDFSCRHLQREEVGEEARRVVLLVWVWNRRKRTTPLYQKLCT
jgi:hypothetical protein